MTDCLHSFRIVNAVCYQCSRCGTIREVFVPYCEETEERAAVSFYSETECQRHCDRMNAGSCLGKPSPFYEVRTLASLSDSNR